MTGLQDLGRGKFCYTGFHWDGRVRSNHPSRKVEGQIGSDFVLQEVADKHGFNGNVSFPPPIPLKLMLLLVLQSARSGRDLMDIGWTPWTISDSASVSIPLRTLPRAFALVPYMIIQVLEKTPSLRVSFSFRKFLPVSLKKLGKPHVTDPLWKTILL